MALEIKEKDGIFHVLGHITSQNITMVKTHISHILQVSDKIMVSLERVSSIDSAAVKSLQRFYRETALKNKVLCIFGIENSNISEEMQSNNANYIFNSDRV